MRKGGKSRGGVGKGGKSRGGVEWNLLERENVHVLKNDVVCEKVFAYVRSYVNGPRTQGPDVTEVIRNT